MVETGKMPRRQSFLVHVSSHPHCSQGHLRLLAPLKNAPKLSPGAPISRICQNLPHKEPEPAPTSAPPLNPLRSNTNTEESGPRLSPCTPLYYASRLRGPLATGCTTARQHVPRPPLPHRRCCCCCYGPWPGGGGGRGEAGEGRSLLTAGRSDAGDGREGEATSRWT